jgi:hypothetical protein
MKSNSINSLVVLLVVVLLPFIKRQDRGTIV